MKLTHGLSRRAYIGKTAVAGKSDARLPTSLGSRAHMCYRTIRLPMSVPPAPLVVAPLPFAMA